MTIRKVDDASRVVAGGRRAASRARHDTRGGRLLCVGTVMLALACACTRDAPSEARTEAAIGVPSAAARAGTEDDWCAEHALPESMCTKCDPSKVATFKEAGDFCAAHGFPESVCPVCNPQAPPPSLSGREGLEARIVRFRAPDLEAAAGIETVIAKRAERAPILECTAQIAFDADRVAEVRALVPGVVTRVLVSLGARVEAGDPLFELRSTRVGETQAAAKIAREQVRIAESNLERQRELQKISVSSARKVELAEQELAAARAELRSSETTLRMAGAGKAAASGRSTLTAPITGTVVRRDGVVGRLATEDAELATIVDTSVMWVLADVSAADASRVAVGQKLEVEVEGSKDEAVSGTITWIASEVDPRTRTVAVRAELDNPDGRLRANQFARARIETGAPAEAIAVPRDAVQRVGGESLVFVRTGEGVYAPRVVEIVGGEDPVLVRGDVEDGASIVTTGAVLLKTEVMPGSIGAGCCEVEGEGDGDH